MHVPVIGKLKKPIFRVICCRSRKQLQRFWIKLMRQINFLLIFALCLALVLFGLENTQSVSIRIIDGIQVKAPLAIALILSMWLGAVIAWLFNLWTRFINFIGTRKMVGQIRSKDEQIRQLEDDIQQYKIEIEQKQLLLSASDPLSDNPLLD
ncbi:MULTISPECIES: LapA family protein [unclassified Moorena]|uniref:LapA family protein n=1 Tax=unclassified Moorena TaxID=2683338 RepID=UPI0025F6CCC7|nr:MULTISPECIES: LapA family protein [unclassified Moorena]